MTGPWSPSTLHDKGVCVCPEQVSPALGEYSNYKECTQKLPTWKNVCREAAFHITFFNSPKQENLFVLSLAECLLGGTFVCPEVDAYVNVSQLVIQSNYFQAGPFSWRYLLCRKNIACEAALGWRRCLKGLKGVGGFDPPTTYTWDYQLSEIEHKISFRAYHMFLFFNTYCLLGTGLFLKWYISVILNKVDKMLMNVTKAQVED